MESYPMRMVPVMLAEALAVTTAVTLAPAGLSATPGVATAARTGTLLPIQKAKVMRQRVARNAPSAVTGPWMVTWSGRTPARAGQQGGERASRCSIKGRSCRVS